jgi:hypothetical protein
MIAIPTTSGHASASSAPARWTATSRRRGARSPSATGGRATRRSPRARSSNDRARRPERRRGGNEQRGRGREPDRAPRRRSNAAARKTQNADPLLLRARAEDGSDHEPRQDGAEGRSIQSRKALPARAVANASGISAVPDGRGRPEGDAPARRGGRPPPRRARRRVARGIRRRARAWRAARARRRARARGQSQLRAASATDASVSGTRSGYSGCVRRERGIGEEPLGNPAVLEDGPRLEAPDRERVGPRRARCARRRRRRSPPRRRPRGSGSRRRA